MSFLDDDFLDEAIDTAIDVSIVAPICGSIIKGAVDSWKLIHGDD